MKNKRYIGAVIYLIPTLIIIFLGGNILKYGLMVLSLMGLSEFYGALKKKNYKPFEIVGYGTAIVYYILIGQDIRMATIGFLISLTLMVLLVLPIFKNDRSIADSALTMFGIMYVAGLLSLIYLIGEKEFGIYLIWIIFFTSWSCDTAAYFIGKNFGKRKIAPKTSPNKTLEGSIAGFVASTVVATIYGYIAINYFGVNIGLIHFAVIGGICGVLNQIGDLTASSIKRQMDIKDFGNLIPGHGGILDRFDSILFAAFVVYYYISIIL